MTTDVVETVRKVVFPNYFLILAYICTGINLLSGLLGIFYTFRGTPSDLQIAYRLLLIGVFFDYFDGKLARKAHTKSDIGIYADSFADLFTFVLLPAYMVLQTNLYLGKTVILPFITLAEILAAIYAIGGWYRLIRFSSKPTGPKFEGLPSAGAAIFIGALTAITTYFSELTSLNIVLTISVVISGILMVSKFEYPSPKVLLKPDNYFLMIGMLIGLFFIIIPNPVSAIFVFIISCIYLILGPIYFNKSIKQHLLEEQEHI